MSALLSLALLLAPPPSDDSAGSGDDAPAPVQSDTPERPQPPPPTLDGPPPKIDPPPERPPPSLEPELAPDSSAATTPPGEASAPPIPVEPPPSEAELEYAGRDPADMPYGATAARKSAVQRNNDVLVRPFRRPVYTVAASARFATLLSGGADVVQPFGYGFAMQLRLHVLPVVKSRFGVEVHAGHTRFSQRNNYESFAGGGTITRITLLTHTDFSAGPSFDIPLGPLFVQIGGSAGVALSTLFRPQSADPSADEAISATNFMLRGGASLGIPVLNRHGVTIGAGVHHIFSPVEVALDPTNAESETTRPFGTWLEILAGYQIWF